MNSSILNKAVPKILIATAESLEVEETYCSFSLLSKCRKTPNLNIRIRKTNKRKDLNKELELL